MDIDLDMSVLELDEYRQEQLNNTQVSMSCPNDHKVPVRLIRGAGSSIIYCPECSELVEPRLPDEFESRQQSAT
ncbi:MAG TPA: hypothetical protein VNH22_04390 [Blastocatellia bacterium]|nr:hypothetical protein [Blastocatellia bacterium]